MTDSNNSRIFSFLSLLIGFIVFSYFCDLKLLNPLNYKWLLAGDPAQHYLGWQTFRNTPLIQWPLGLNYNYGMETSNSIVFTDSIPLVAIFLKYFSALLPVNFQYTGIWLLLCYMLQSFFGFRLVLEITRDKLFSLFAGFILAFCPFFLARTFNHFALSAQFLILAAMLFYVRKEKNMKWTFLVCITAMVHAYLLVMVLAICASRMAVTAFEEKDFLKQSLLFTMTMATCLLVMYAAGYFVIKNGVTAGGYGIYRADVLAIFNPVFDFFSRFMRTNNYQLTNGEGLAYIGLGMIASMSALITRVSRAIIGREIKFSSARVLIPVGSMIILCAFAISNVISIQGHEIYRVTLPHSLENAFNTFRAGGRFIWPFAYILMIACIISVYNKSKITSLIAISMISAIQFIDVSGFHSHANDHIANSSLSGELISTQGYKVDYSSYKSIAMLPPKDFKNKSPIIYLAAINKLPVNSGYMARFDTKKESQQEDKLMRTIKKKDLSNDTIYFLGKSAEDVKSLCSEGFVCENGYSGMMIYKGK